MAQAPIDNGYFNNGTNRFNTEAAPAGAEPRLPASYPGAWSDLGFDPAAFAAARPALRGENRWSALSLHVRYCEGFRMPAA
jgi:hypothetical protein